MQTQIGNPNTGSSGGDIGGGGDDPNVGTIISFILTLFILYIYTNMLELIFVWIT